MLRTIDRVNGFFIQKITDQKGKVIRYQICPQGERDASKVKSFDHLFQARMAAQNPQPNQ